MGSIYIIGFERGLRESRRLLVPGGYIAVTEVMWTTPDPPCEAVEFWNDEYPAIRGIEKNLDRAMRCGYEVVDHFKLPDEDWTADFYDHLEPRLDELEPGYQDDKEAFDFISMCRREMEIFRRYSTSYGYVFVIMRKKSTI